LAACRLLCTDNEVKEVDRRRGGWNTCHHESSEEIRNVSRANREFPAEGQNMADIREQLVRLHSVNAISRRIVRFIIRRIYSWVQKQ